MNYQYICNLIKNQFGRKNLVLGENFYTCYDNARVTAMLSAVLNFSTRHLSCVASSPYLAACIALEYSMGQCGRLRAVAVLVLAYLTISRCGPVGRLSGL